MCMCIRVCVCERVCVCVGVGAGTHFDLPTRNGRIVWAVVTTTHLPESLVTSPEAESVVVPESKSENDWSLR